MGKRPRKQKEFIIDTTPEDDAVALIDVKAQAMIQMRKAANELEITNYSKSVQVRTQVKIKALQNCSILMDALGNNAYWKEVKQIIAPL